MKEEISPLRHYLDGWVCKLLICSLRTSIAQRGDGELKKKLAEIVPDISRQYTVLQIAAGDAFLQEKVRSQHTFQIGLLLKAVELFSGETKREIVNVVDIGDSSGTHLRYLHGIYEGRDVKIRSMSVNLDPEAIQKIEALGLKARQCRAEELHLQENGIGADIFISFEMLEHLFDPIGFLHDLAVHSACTYFVLTVPYIRRSRVGLHHLRHKSKEPVYAENTHIFELCPRDWSLIFSFSGWETVFEDCFTQYPSGGLLHLTKYLWRRKDFDGFWGVILKRTPDRAAQYRNW